jgi:hypothetical protein
VIWLVWRQHRGQLIAGAAGVALLSIFLFVTGTSMQHTFESSGLAACIEHLGDAPMVNFVQDEGCRDLGAVFASRFFGLRLLGLVLFTLIPLLMGMFWGAPLIAREVEQGTHALVWTQGVTRRRWALANFAAVTAMTAIVVAAYAWVVTWWYGPLNAATGERFQWLIFDQQGLVPVGYALFALALGVLSGAIFGRTLRAMAVTVVGFLVVRFGVAVWLRPHYLAALERKYPVLGITEPNRLIGDWLIGGGGPGVGAVYDALGHKLKGGQMMCPPPVSQACIDQVGRGAYNFEIYQPANRFWTFQSIETAVFVALAVLLLFAAAWWVRHRMT